MRVVQFERQQLAAGLDHQLVGPWRQRQQAGIGGHRFDQQGALGGAVEHPQFTGAVQRDEALAALLGNDLADRRIAHLEVADMLEALLIIRVAGHKPLADAALGVADHQGNAAEQLAAGGHFAAGVLQ